MITRKIKVFDFKNIPCFEKIDPEKSYFKQKSWLVPDSATEIKACDLAGKSEQKWLT